jgi:hypothetical protein
VNLLAGKLYDPGTAVNKVTTGLLALTALDTTNLRLAFVVPPSGIVLVRLKGVLHGATTFPQIMLGVLEGSTVRGRQAPMTGGGNLAATTLQQVEAQFLVTGLTPAASLNWDAAYGVETVVASTGLKYGGPNNTTANDNFGGFAFEIWDPCSVYTPSAGAAPTSTVHVKVDAVQADTDNIQTRLPAALVSGRMDASVGAMAADVVTAAAIANGAIDAATFAAGAINAAAIADGAIDAATFAAGSITATVIADGAIDAATFAANALDAVWSTAARTLTAGTNLPTAAGIADAVWDEAIAGHLGAGSTGLALNGAGAAGDPWSTALPGAYGAGTAGSIIGNNLDAAVSSRLATAGYTAPDNATITAIDAKTTNLPSDPADASIIAAATGAILSAVGDVPTAAEIHAELTELANLDAAVSTRMATFTYTAPDNTGIAAIQAKTDSLTFTMAGKLDVNVLVVNGVTLQGDGSAGDLWRPA